MTRRKLLQAIGATVDTCEIRHKCSTLYRITVRKIGYVEWEVDEKELALADDPKGLLEEREQQAIDAFFESGKATGLLTTP